MPPSVNTAQLNNQQTQILAYIDFVIGIASLAALIFLIVQMTRDIKKEQHIYLAICALFVISIVVETVLAVLVLQSSKNNRAYPFRKSILITIKVFLFIVSLCGVIILFCHYIIAAIIGTFLLKYKLYSFWVLWSVPDNYIQAPNSDKVFIISQQL